MDAKSTMSLDQHLKAAGLEPSYWCPIFEKNLSVISVLGLKHVREEFLKPFARSLEEKKSVKKVLTIACEEKNYKMLREGQRQNLEKRSGEYKQNLMKLKTNEQETQQTRRKMFELLQVPPEYCLLKESPMEVSSQLETFHENITNALKGADHDAASLIRTASDGLALQGILLTKEFSDHLQQRDTLLKVPTQIELMPNYHAEHETIEVFTTKEEEDIFVTTIIMLGYSDIAVSKSALSLYNAKDCDNVKDPDNTYCCTIKHFTVPLASYFFKNSTIQLSDNAVKHLKGIEKFVSSNSSSLQRECRRFFNKFGSHANRGPIHFGGSYQWKSYSCKFKHQSLGDIKKLQREAIDFQVQLSADTAVSVEDYTSELRRTYDPDLKKNTFLEMTRIGGAQEAIGLPDWKNGLIASNKTWNVVDRGTALVPIWEIIELEHVKRHFKNASGLAKVMKQAMETMNSNHHEVNICVEGIEISEMIKEWNENEDMPSSEDKLARLVEKKQELAKNTLNSKAWPIYCLSQQLLQQFLRTIIDTHFHHDSGRSKSKWVKDRVLQLVEPTDLDIVNEFPDRQYFCKLLYDREMPPVPMKIENFLDVEAYFHYTLDYMYAGMPRSDERIIGIASKPSTCIQVTAVFAKNMLLLRKHLQGTEQYYEELFIVTILFPFNYDPDSYSFSTLISACDIEYLCAEYESYCTHFFKVLTSKSSMKKNLPVYILSMALELCEDINVIEPQRKCLVEYIGQKISDDGDLHNIAETLQKLKTKDYDWKWFKEELKALISDVSLLPKKRTKSNKKVAMQRWYAKQSTPKPMAKRGASQPVKKTLKPPQNAKPFPKRLSPQTPMQYKDQRLKSQNVFPPTEFVSKSQYELFFIKLGLNDYRPQRLTVRRAVEINGETIKSLGKARGPNSTPFMDPQLYLFTILHKIMVVDFNCRIKLTIQADKSQMGRKESSSIDLSEFGLDKEPVVETIHPMDGILALLHCADNFLRQDLMSRMTTCQLAIPLLLPDPFTDKLIFPLWAMRSIVKEWKGAESTNEGPLVSHPAPLVSFSRIGAHRCSKSRIINTVISDSGHDCFFHYDCDGGTAKHLLVNGLVEVCWHLPSGTKSVFPDVVTFANLHGDARELPKQVNFLSELSLINFVLLNLTDLGDKRSSEVLKNLAKTPGGLVLLVATPTVPDNTVWKGQLKEVQALLPKDKFDMIVLDMNEADIRDKVRLKIKQKIEMPKRKFCVLEECSEIAHKYQIITDEDEEDVVKGKKLACELKEVLKKHSESNKSVKELLPLQGRELWHEWAKHNKEQYRQFDRQKSDRQGSVNDYVETQRNEMEKIRKKQMKKEHSELMNTFLKNLVHCQGTARLYFLHWLKIILDDLSRKQIAKLHRQYQKKKEELRDLQKNYQITLEQLKKSGNENEKKKEFKKSELCLKKEVNEVNENIIDSTFGIEHLLREIGQVYEAVKAEANVMGHVPQDKEQFLNLPRVAAELLIEGQPLELMDGDAAHVPETWVSAVLEQMQEMLKNPRVLVLSIVGLQSTGKSTLMNTVFGLQFSVSAGRCTRGAFMQLVSIHSSLRQECKCDFFLIIDTEGLRAPELDALSAQKHDNELATFVMGLANLTIVNISGEVAGDIEDILQTAVHAFLRMRKVNLTPGCHFVHHNVAAVMAGEKGVVGRSKFNQKLDEMTQLVAKEEHVEDDYDSFSQVIKFDDVKDVTHFPSLWKGDPPMAPVNDGYSLKAQGLNSYFIGLVKSNVIHAVQISVFRSHLKQLWKAILHENFVFSFKNTYEFVAYNALEKEYGKWAWKLQASMMEWEQQTQNKISSCNPDQLNTVCAKCKTDLSTFVLKKYSDADNKMKEYFRTSDKREIIKQWEARTSERLKDLQRQLNVHAVEHCEQLFYSQKTLDDVKARKNEYRARIFECVKQLASKLEKRELNDYQLEQMFDEEWREWMKQLRVDKPITLKQVDVLSEVTKSLSESNIIIKNCNAVLIRKIGETPLEQWGPDLALRINITHLEMDSAVLFDHTMPAIIEAQTVTDDIFKKVREYLDQKRKVTFHPSLTVQLIFIIHKDIDKARSNNFKFTQDYIADMMLTTCGYAVEVFGRMVQNFIKKNDPVEYMEREMKQPLLSLFKDLYCKIAQEKIAARNLCALLYNSVKKEVMSTLCHRVISYMVTEFPWIPSKPALKSKLLLHIGEKLEESRNNFDECALYLTDIKKSLQEWIKRFTIRECERGNPSQLVCLANDELLILVSYLKKMCNRVTKIVLKKIEEVEYEYIDEEYETDEEIENEDTGKEIVIAEWLLKYHESVVGRLALDANELSAFRGTSPQLINAYSFTREVITALETMHARLKFNDLKMSQASDMGQWSSEPYDIICDIYSGCTEQCPFCKEQCDYTDKGHTRDHSVTLHRPECLGGYKWNSNKKMVLDLCTTSVGSDVTFERPETDNKPHPYKEYKDIYPEWTILEDLSIEASSFWKWVVAKYATEIATKFGIKQAKIPSKWKHLRWQEVSEELQEIVRVDLEKIV